MKHHFFIDLAGNYRFKWHSANDTSSMVLSREYGYDFTFICNCHAQISQGDVYRVVVDSEKDELFFFLKTGFKKMNSKVVEDYMDLRHIKW